MTSAENITEGAGPDDARPSRRRWRVWPWLLAAFLLLLTYNAWVTIPVLAALSDEDDFTVIAYRQWLISPDTIVFDVWSAGDNASIAAMDRNLFKAAEALKERRYEGVVLAYRGSGRFVLGGNRFQTVGRERTWQNPVYVIRTLQRDVTDMNGAPAFAPLYGGWLGVLAEEINQHNELHRRWWLDDALRG